MKIVPNRTMRLGGRRVEFGKAVDVPEDDAAMALRHGWAVEAPAKRGPAPKADSTATVEAAQDAPVQAADATTAAE